MVFVFHRKNRLLGCTPIDSEFGEDMKQDPTEHYEAYTERSLDGTRETFGVRITRGTESQESTEERSKGQSEHPGSNRHRRLFVDVKDSIPTLLIQATTLLLLGATVIFTYRQLGEAIKATKASADSANAAVIAANVAKDSFSHALEREKEQDVIERDVRGEAKSEAKRSATLAQNSLRATVDISRRDQRAWMGFSLGPEAIQLGIGQTFSVPTILINSGKTPARDVRGKIVVGVFDRGQPIDFSYGSGQAHYDIAAGTVFPSGYFSESFMAIRHGESKPEPILITQPMRTAIESNEKFVAVHGTITYTDIFNVNHWTRYCRVITNPSLIPMDCVQYNSTDDK